MGSNEDQDLPVGPLSEQEIRRLRIILRSDDRTQWFWASARIWAGWIIGAPTAIYAAYLAIRGMLGLGVER